MSDWIRTTKQQPERGRLVDIFVKGRRLTDYYYLSTTTVFRSKQTGFEKPRGLVSYWMYSPDPPK